MKDNIPNILTFSRGIATICIAVVMLSALAYKFYIALGLFLYASITDYLDGYLARKYGWTSNIGIVFDSLFDKILILTMFLLLTPYDVINAGVFIALMFRDVLIDGVKNYLLSKNKPVSAKFSGKIKFASQVFLIIFLLLYLIEPLIWLYYLSVAFATSSIVFAYYSGYFYLKEFFHT
jgi:CDP-diacylglycerol--glycerol-3-phosphate 3-phosphatidyltransferase